MQYEIQQYLETVFTQEFLEIHKHDLPEFANEGIFIEITIEKDCGVCDVNFQQY